MCEGPGTGDRSTTDPVRALRRWVIVVLVAMLCIEAANTARMWATPTTPRRFPLDYVSRGLWSLGSYVRPPTSSRPDIAGPIKASDFVTDVSSGL